MTRPVEGTRFLSPLLVATDFAATLSFYRDLVGLPFQGSKPYAECRTDSSLLAIIDREFMARSRELELPIQPVAGLTSETILTLEVADLDSAFERLMGAGVRFLQPPSDRIPLGRKYAFLRDPDGRTLALMGPRFSGV